MNKWIDAARLRTLPLSLSGIVLAGFLVPEQQFDWIILFLSVLTASLFQILSNYANDYGDGIKGTDNQNRVGPERALQSGIISPSAMKKAVIFTGILSFISALFLIVYSFGTENILYAILYMVLGIAAIVAAIKYTVGKSAYGYYGMGDFFVLIFFGLVSVLGGYFLYTKETDYSILFPALSIGMLSVAVLNLNNMRDIENDRKSNKNTIPVKLGLENAKKYHIVLITLPFFLSSAYIFHHIHSKWQWLFVIPYLFLFIHLIKIIQTNNPKDFDPELKKVALLSFLFSLLFGLGNIL